MDNGSTDPQFLISRVVKFKSSWHFHRYSGERREGFQGLRGPTGVGHQVYLPGEGDDGGRRRLAGGGGKPGKGAEELGEAKEDIGEGGSDGADIGGFLQGRGATSPIIRG